MGNEQNLNFHNTFRLSRPRLAEVLATVERIGSASSKDLSGTSLGKNMHRPFLNWGVMSGLLEPESKNDVRLSVFGESTRTHDPSLSDVDSQWLMHFHLTHQDGIGPAFWQRLVTTYFGRSFPLSNESMAPDILSAHFNAHTEASAKKAAGIFLSTYSEPDCLGSLGLITEVSGKSYLPNAPQRPISALGLLYCLIETWSIRQPKIDTMPLNDLFLPGGIADTLLLDREEIEDRLNSLKAIGLLDVYRTAPPHQIVRFWQDPDAAKRGALERMYAYGH